MRVIINAGWILVACIAAVAATKTDTFEDVTIAIRHAAVYAGHINCETDYECEVLSPVGPVRRIGPNMYCDDPWFYGTDEPMRDECEQ